MKSILLLAMLAIIDNTGMSQTPKKTETVSLNGTTIYYEVYGKGSPLFLLHGFTQSSKYWHPYVNDYIDNFEVYLVDLKGHGKSAPFTERLSIKAAAEDVRALIAYLKLDSIRGIGYSYGGDILFRLTLLQPGLIQSMISTGACGSWDVKNFPDWADFLSYKNIDNLKWMREQQTSEAQIRAILEQMPNYIVSISDEELKSIRTKTLIVVGDHDNSITMEEIARVRKNLLDSYLWILPNTNHGAHEGKNKQEFVKTAKAFFRGEWNDH